MTSSEHRKIELQSPQDLAHLTTQLRTAALQKLNLHLPAHPDTSEPDDLRSNVEDLVNAFVAHIIAGMRLNISINGMDVVQRDAGADADVDAEAAAAAAAGVEKDEYEAFDEKVRAQLASTVQKRDALVAKISAHRRNTPALAARRFEDEFVRGMEALERQGEENMAMAMAVEGSSSGEDGGEDGVRIEGLQRQGEVERNWERAVEGLARLNHGLPETRARLERCGHVVGYVGGNKEAV